MKTIQELEEMLKKGAFDQFEKERDTEVLYDKKRELLDNMAEREDEPFLEYETTNKPLTRDEALEFGKYITKNELIELIEKKYPSMKTQLNIIELLIELSKQGIVPIIPIRIANCCHCGVVIEYRNIQLTIYWKMLDKSIYCDNCKKLIDELNKPETKQVLLL